jgi:hypothetical protein
MNLIHHLVVKAITEYQFLWISGSSGGTKSRRTCYPGIRGGFKPRKSIVQVVLTEHSCLQGARVGVQRVNALDFLINSLAGSTSSRLV